MRKHRKLQFIAAALGIAVAVPLVCAEIFLRIRGPMRVHGIVFPDPVLHHAHKPGSLVRIESITREFGGFDMAFDADGCHINPGSEEKHGREPFRIAMMGDSFAEAAQLSEERSFCGRIARELKDTAWVRNYGVSSYSPALYELQWRTKIAAWKPTHAVVMLYCNDLDPAGEVSDSDYLKKAIRNERGEVAAIPGKANPVLSLLNCFHLKWEITRAIKTAKFRLGSQSIGTATSGGFVEPNPDMAEPTTDLLIQIKQQMERAGTKLLLTAVPSKNRNLERITGDEIEFADKAKAWAEASGIGFIDLAGPFREVTAAGKKLFFDEDIHFNEAGHELAAAVIGEELRHRLQSTPRLALTPAPSQGERGNATRPAAQSNMQTTTR